jgi:hypothetical protein
MIIRYFLYFDLNNYKYEVLVILLGISDFFYSFCKKNLALIISLLSDNKTGSTLCNVQAVIRQFSFMMSTFIVLHLITILYTISKKNKECFETETKSVLTYLAQLFSSLIFSSSVSVYFLYSGKIAKEGFWCFMDSKTAFYEVLLLINGVFLVCMVITVVLNYLAIVNCRERKYCAEMRSKYFPLFQLMFLPIIIFSIIDHILENNEFVQYGLNFGAILASLNGVLNGFFYGITPKNNSKIFCSNDLGIPFRK